MTAEDANTAKLLADIDFKKVKQRMNEIKMKASHKEVRALDYGHLVPTAIAALPSFIINAKVRSHHKIFKLSASWISIAIGILPPTFASGVNNLLWSRMMFASDVKSNACSICHQVRQVSTSLAWGLVFGTVTSLVANQMNLNRLSIKNQGFFPWSYVILKKSSFGLGVTLLLHLVLVTWVAEEQHQEWKRIFIKALRAIDAEKSGSLRFETKIQDPLIS